MALQILNDCPAPAKLNLFLHVTGRRTDGYHTLQTAFQLIDFCDLLHFELRSDDAIRRINGIPGLAEEADLIVRAARLLQKSLQPKSHARIPGVNILVEKRLPMGGGLGGGSSDAATTLIALNHLWRGGLNQLQLMALGLQLGADVPFFLFGQNAFAEGIGELLQPIALPACWFVVIEPGVAVPTSEIFKSPELTRDSKPVRISDFSSRPNDFGRNDLQPVAAGLFPPVGLALEWLARFGNARMTGSGACVFCSFHEEDDADEVLMKVPLIWKGWKARTLDRHPLTGLVSVK